MAGADIPALAPQERIAGDVRTVGSDPAIIEKVASLGSVVRVGTSADFVAAIEAQRSKIAALHGASDKQDQ